MIDESSEEHFRAGLEESLCMHIFSVSSAMVGVCLTVIGIIQVLIKGQKATTFADDLLAVDALLFLSSCILSYWALRRRGIKRMHKIEQVADTIFLCAMVLMAIICVLITFDISYHKPLELLNSKLNTGLFA
ncbi:MAG: hypothetical protein HGB20_04805 [Chlorobiaceae bacterium]|nr:hypothetical protein [Chlorobiaceae bacterium]